MAFLTRSGYLFPVLGFRLLRTGYQREDDVGVNPRVELLHEAHWFLLFGHMLVPFGKLECFGSGQLALLTAPVA